jgi:CopG antitoxin of type II toxin-antitoxin system
LLGERGARNHSQCHAEQELQATAEFWDTHSLAVYGDQTEPAAFEVAPEARRRYLVAVDREVLARVQRLARTRGVSSESLVNLLLEQRLREVESQAAKA